VLESSASTLSDEKPNVTRDFRQVVVELVVPTVQAANHSLRKSLCVQLDVPKRHDFIVAAMVEKHGNPFRQPGAEILRELEISTVPTAFVGFWHLTDVPQHCTFPAVARQQADIAYVLAFALAT
jgi:hypothetical protein